jgi:hypothetical protein
MSTFKVDTESRNKLNMQMIHRKGHHRDKRPSMVSEMGSRVRGSYGNLPHNYNSRTTSFGSNRAISLDHYNHRRMSDGIQTVTSDSTVYYHQRVNEQDVLLRASAASDKRSSSCQGSTEVKLVVSEDPMGKSEAAEADENEEPNRVQLNNNSSLTSKTLKSKLASSVSCSPKSQVNTSPKSILTRLRQLTGRLSFSFDKESRRMSSGTQTIIKTSPASTKNNNAMANICCNAKSSACGPNKSGEAQARNRAYSLDVPATKYYNNSSGASSNDGSRKSLSSNKNDDADDSADNNSVFASKKLSSEAEATDI